MVSRRYARTPSSPDDAAPNREKVRARRPPRRYRARRMLRAHPHPGGILGGPVDGPARLAAEYSAVEGVQGLSVLHRASGFVGTVAECTKDSVVLTGGTGLAK